LLRNPYPYDGEDSHLTLVLLILAFTSLRGPHTLTNVLLPTQRAYILDSKSCGKVSAADLVPYIFEPNNLGE